MANKRMIKYKESLQKMAAQMRDRDIEETMSEVLSVKAVEEAALKSYERMMESIAEKLYDKYCNSEAKPEVKPAPVAEPKPMKAEPKKSMAELLVTPPVEAVEEEKPAKKPATKKGKVKINGFEIDIDEAEDGVEEPAPEKPEPKPAKPEEDESLEDDGMEDMPDVLPW